MNFKFSVYRIYYYLGGDIHFDEDEDWNPEAKNGQFGLDFFTVAVSFFLNLVLRNKKKPNAIFLPPSKNRCMK